MKNNRNTVMIVYGIVFVIFNVLFWCIPFPKGEAAVILYIFSLLSIVAGCGITMFAFSKGTDLRSKVYGFPLFRLGYIYMAVQIVFTAVICIINAFVDVPVWIGIVVSVLISGLSAIGIIGADTVRNVITEQEQQLAVQTKKIKYFRLDVDSIAARCPEGKLKNKISDLAEEFKYSDPVSSDALADIEQKLSEEVTVLKALVSANPDEALKKADEVHFILAERNQLCKATKNTIN